MPELPEVETIRRSLEPGVVGKRLRRVDVRERRLRKRIADDFEQSLCGRRVCALSRRGKYLLAELDNGNVLLVHLGMSGSLELRDEASEVRAHDHVRFYFAASPCLVFNDPRRFGVLRVGRERDLDELRRVGADPLSVRLDVAEWRAMARRRRVAIKSLLMDQTFFAGVGNIYANEMLFLARIRPRRRADTLRLRELAALSEAMPAVLERAVRLGGSSISDFRDAQGRPGYFQIHHAVYDRAGEPCPECGAAIRRVTHSGRSSFYCPQCQV